ncbi:MAG: hypothetical protein AB8E15_03870 [Bdellovibrionales bacterium]
MLNKILKSNSEFLYYSLGLGVFTLSLMISLHPGMRYEIRTSLDLNKRVVLGTITANIIGEADSIQKIIKVRDGNGIYIEVYSMSDSEELLGKLAIPDAHDGYFNIQGESSNLMVNDIDGDSYPEIIAPSFDKNLVAHLNVFKFDRETNSFFLLSSEESK